MSAPITEAEWANIVKQHPKVAPAALARWRKYIIRAAGGEDRRIVPAELGNGRLAEMGYVDVTAAPFNADATRASDVTGRL